MIGITQGELAFPLDQSTCSILSPSCFTLKLPFEASDEAPLRGPLRACEHITGLDKRRFCSIHRVTALSSVR